MDAVRGSDWGAFNSAPLIHPVVLGAGRRLFEAPLTIEPVSTTAFSGGAVAHVFAALP